MRNPFTSISRLYGRGVATLECFRTFRISRVSGVITPPSVRWSMWPWLTIEPGVGRAGSRMISLIPSWTTMPSS